MHRHEQPVPSPERESPKDKGWIKRLIASRALKSSEELGTQAPDAGGSISSEELKLDFHGDLLIIDNAAIQQSRPSRPHLAFFDARTKQYEYAKLSDIRIEHDGKYISYTRYLKLVGSPTVY